MCGPEKKSCVYFSTFPYISFISLWESARITTCVFFETNYFILVNLQAVAGGKFYRLPPDKESTDKDKIWS